MSGIRGAAASQHSRHGRRIRRRSRDTGLLSLAQPRDALRADIWQPSHCGGSRRSMQACTRHISRLSCTGQNFSVLC